MRTLGIYKEARLCLLAQHRQSSYLCQDIYNKGEGVLHSSMHVAEKKLLLNLNQVMLA